MMRYQVIATDYDGTLATEGSVDAPTLVTPGRYREAGGRFSRLEQEYKNWWTGS